PRDFRLRSMAARSHGVCAGPRLGPRTPLFIDSDTRSCVSRWTIMYVLYEDSGNFKAEKIFSHSDPTMQVESESGQRSKIKNASVLFSFEQPSPSVLLEEATTLAATLDIGFLWECAPQEEFEASSFAEDYFGHPPGAVEKAALIFALNNAPAYFH